MASAANGNGNGFCTDTKILTITQPDAVVLTAGSTNVSCNGAANGTITASATGTGTLTITVNGNPYDANATYGPGTYTVVASAANGNGNGFCTDTKILTITQPDAVMVRNGTITAQPVST